MEQDRTDFGNPFDIDYLGNVDYIGKEISGFLVVLLFLVVVCALILGKAGM
jgi:hypothetical protein